MTSFGGMGPCGCLNESLPTLGWARAHLGVESDRGQQFEVRGREQGVDSAQAGRSAPSLFWAVIHLAASELLDPTDPFDGKLEK